MAPRVCFYGRAGTGSFEVRGRQVAAARPGWWSTAALSPDDLLDADVVVFVKRLEPRKQRLVRALGKRVVHDIVDDWRQPEDDLLVRDLAGARALFARRLGGLAADAVIYPSRAMAEDLGDLLPAGEVIDHHFRPGLAPAPLRERVEVVAYEGDPRFLGRWRDELAAACRRRGWRFVVNPPDLAQADIGVAVRGEPHAGYLSLRYKSNVKLANLIGAGVPALVQAGAAAYVGQAPGGVRAFSTPDELEAGLEALAPLDARRAARERLLAARERFTLEAVVARYEALLDRVLATAAVGAP